ncbi:alginate lyase family protein [Mucilaginibacter koreensis]
MKKRYLLSTFGLLFTVSVQAQQVSLTNKELHKLKAAIRKDTAVAKLYTAFQHTADQALLEEPNPITKITSQGLLEGNPAKTASLKAVRDADKIYALALAYRLSEKKVYLDKAITYLTAWAKVNEATGDPIDETKLEALFVGYDLIYKEVSPEEKHLVDEWLTRIADSEVNSKYAKGSKGTAINNWNSHRIKIITLIAYALHQNKYDVTITDALKKQIEVNLNADGTSLDFEERDAFHYHTYDLEPLLTAITTINRATKENYFKYTSSKGASIKKSVDFMIPYMLGKKQHAEFVNSKVEFDRKRAANHEKGYEAGTPFNPQNGAMVMALASYFDKKYTDVLKEASIRGNIYEQWQALLSTIKR